MEEAGDVCMLMTAVDREAAAQTLAQGLVEAQLAACVQVLPVKSFYVWQGESRRDAEYLLLVKIPVALSTALETFVRAASSLRCSRTAPGPCDRRGGGLAPMAAGRDDGWVRVRPVLHE